MNIKKRVLVTGASGFVGKALILELSKHNYSVWKLVRHKPTADNEIYCDYIKQEIDLNALEDFQAVIHLAGDNVASGRWTKAKKERIYNSRVKYTSFLVESISKLKSKPTNFISASAIGIYGNRPNEQLTEDSNLGSGFLAEVCKDWEESSKKLSEQNIKVANLRIGIVIGKGGGALEKMLPIFKLGLGGKLGDGKQVMSWISLTDLVSAIIFTLENNLAGPINLTSPNPVSNEEFTKALGKALKRPTIFPVPAFILNLALGDFAKEALLSGAYVLPQKLLSSGFQFKDPALGTPTLQADEKVP